MSENNPNELAGVSSDHIPVEEVRDPDTAREIFPVAFEKDFMDFRPTDPSLEEGVVVPKYSSAPVSVTEPTLVTGLEDVSSVDLENPAQVNVEKDKNQTSS